MVRRAGCEVDVGWVFEGEGEGEERRRMERWWEGTTGGMNKP